MRLDARIVVAGEWMEVSLVDAADGTVVYRHGARVDRELLVDTLWATAIACERLGIDVESLTVDGETRQLEPAR